MKYDRPAALLLLALCCALAPATASPPSASAQMVLNLNTDATTAFDLFGPAKEGAWSPQWAPHFIGPPPYDRAGTVFTTQHMGKHALHRTIWIVDRYDADRHEIAYAYLAPGLLTQLDIVVQPVSPLRSRAIVTHTLTALDPSGAPALRYLRQEAADSQAAMEQAINQYLATRKS